MQTLAKRGEANAKPATLITRYNRSEIVATVESGSRPGKAHTVRIDRYTGKGACTCEAGSHGRHCYHIQATLGAASELGLLHDKAESTSRKFHERREARAVIDDFNPFAEFGNPHEGEWSRADEEEARRIEEQSWANAYYAELGYVSYSKSFGGGF